MELNTFQQTAFDHQRPTIEKFGKRAWFWTFFFPAMDCCGRICLVFTDRQRAWGNRDA